MSDLLTLLGLVTLGSILSLAGGVFLVSKRNLPEKLLHAITSFAAGAFLGAALFDLLPEAAAEAEHAGTGTDIFLWLFFGIIGFFLLERFIHRFHSHTPDHPHVEEREATVPLIILGDSIHNFVDGLVIAVTYMAEPALGLVTALAVAAHEIPQEIGDFGVLLRKGLPRRKVIMYNLLSALAAIVGALIAYFAAGAVEVALPALLALTAGFFIYIATSDLIPEIHHHNRQGFAVTESAVLIAGAGLIWVAIRFLEGGH